MDKHTTHLYIQTIISHRLNIKILNYSSTITIHVITRLPKITHFKHLLVIKTLMFDQKHVKETRKLYLNELDELRIDKLRLNTYENAKFYE